MHILLVCCSFVNSENEPTTGMPKAVVLNANGLQSRKHEVRILTTGNKDRRWKYKGIDIISMGRPVNTAANTYSIARDTFKREIRFASEINKINKEWRIDIIQYAGLWATGLFRDKRIPSVMRVSGYTKLQRSIGRNETAIKVMTFLDQLAIKRMDAVFCPSNIFAKELSDDTGKIIGVIETPFVEDEVIESDRIYKKKLKGKRYILYVGRITWHKGFHVLADSAYKLLSENPDLFIVVAGETVKGNNTLKRELLEKAGEYRDRVLFLGMLNHAKLYPLIRNSAAVVLPSIIDNLPNTCMEAMNLGAIVVGTDGASFEQLIVDGENGFLSEPGNPISFGDKVNKCLNITEDERKRMSINAKSTIKQHNMNSYLQSLEQLYVSVI